MESKIIQCGLCFEEFSKIHVPMVIQCGHTICKLCLEKLKQNKNTCCPFCKETFDYDPIQSGPSPDSSSCCYNCLDEDSQKAYDEVFGK